MRRIGILIVAITVTSGGGVARANDKSAAEVLFLQAKQLEKDGKTAEACDAYGRSQTLDPQLGTQYNLALCDVSIGKLASAWTIFRELAQRDSNAKRKKDSRKRAAGLEARISKLLITTAGPVEPGLKVLRDQDDVTAVLGVEDPVDPATYHVTASATGYQDWSTDVNVAGEGAVITVKIPALTPVETTPSVGVVTPPRANVVGTVRTDAPAPAAHQSHRKLYGIGLAGVGAVSLGVGLYFGSVASSDWSQVKDLCPDLGCSIGNLARGRGLVADTRSAGTLSTILVGAGVVVAAGGVILWLTAPSHGGGEHRDQTALRLVPAGTGVAVTGGF